MEWTDGVDYVGLVEGGADTTIPIDASIARVRSPQAGAVSTFLGTTRDSFEGQEVTALSYEAYTDMAVGSMRELCGKVRQQWSVTKIAVLHKLGDCPIGEVSVLIAVSSPHRKEALEAVQYAIDELKRTVPIWKKEHYATGDAAWKANADINPHVRTAESILEFATTKR